MPANLENSAVATGLGKGQFSFQSQRKAMPKNAKTIAIALISYARKVMLKILHTRLKQYVNQELPDVQVGFRKKEIKLPTSTGSSEKQESSRKASISALLSMPKPLTVWVTINWKFFKRWEYQTT